jgi:hypothetical protein
MLCFQFPFLIFHLATANFQREIPYTIIYFPTSYSHRLLPFLWYIGWVGNTMTVLTLKATTAYMYQYAPPHLPSMDQAHILRSSLTLVWCCDSNSNNGCMVIWVVKRALAGVKLLVVGFACCCPLKCLFVKWLGEQSTGSKRQSA